MYLSKLELHGFKSFAERTVLQFDPGITAIVGPNGCGKSNIVDAVRWVIGEQRARVLRSEKMENVIFNGTSRRRPVGMAEVLLTVENTRGVLPTEYSEVTLGRRLYRSGDSDYLLNNTACRLKDITDLFMDTGMGSGAYSVIELKMVEEILSENAHDRRRLFEEAAGITRYKLRRKQTLGKLDSTQVDLNRVRDLTEEVEKQVRSLKRQAEKASRHREYSTRLHDLELALAQLEYVRLTARLVDLDARVGAVQTTIESLETNERQHDAELMIQRRRLEEAETALKDARESLAAQVAAERALEAEQRLILERLDASHRERERLRVEDAEDAAKRGELEARRNALAAALAEADPEAVSAGEALESATRERDESQRALARVRAQLEAARRDERLADEKRTAAQRRLDRQTARIDFLALESQRLDAERSSLANAVDDARKRADAALASFEKARLNVDAARADVASLSAKRQEAQQAADDARTRQRELERTREGAAAEAQVLKNLVASFEEFPDAVRFLAEEQPGDDRIITVADVLSCPAEYRTALDAALGAYAACVVVPTTADVARAAATLDAGDRGRASFIVLDRIPDAPSPATDTAPFRRLIDLVDVTPGFEPVARLLLGDVLLAKDRPAEIATVPPGSRLVNRDGEYVRADGILHTGSRSHAPSALSGRIARREQLEAVRGRLATLDTELAMAARGVAEADVRLASVEIESARNALRLAERSLADVEKEEARASYEVETMTKRLREHEERKGAIAREQEALEADLATDAAELDALDSALAGARQTRETAEASFRTAEETASRAAATFNEANVRAIQARNRVHNVRLDIDRNESALQTLSDRLAARRRRLTEIDEQVEIWQEDVDALRRKAQAAAESHRPAEEAVGAATTRVATEKATIAATDEVLRELRVERENAMRLEHTHAVQRAEVQTRLSDLVESIYEDMNVRLGEAVIETEGVDEASARAEVQELRQKLRSLGAVNELALESYQEEKERLDFLVEQQRDLESAEKTLLETIKEINSTASRRFLETYDAIDASFRRIFVDLFGDDASAQLSLVDPSDPLETAIEITAKPRGKRPSTIAQLSGGEKTLTAIALLFAIYLVKPSPFCILDEVDAPLDDANVERFMSLIRSFSKDTQFILVTHNKRTMEAADRLYGITMQEQGVSKLVGVRFEDAVEMVGELGARS